MKRIGSEPSNKRQKVLRMAARLFRERGYHSTRMEDIAAGVMLDKGTLYHYFASKSDLLYEIFSESIAIAKVIVPELSNTVEAEIAVDLFIRHQLQSIATRLNESAVYFQESRYLDLWLSTSQVRAIRSGEEAISSALISVIQRGCNSGDFAPVDARTAAQGIVGMCAWVCTWHRPRNDPPLDEVADAYSGMVLSGLRGTTITATGSPGRLEDHR